jgi:hypothetical protein
MIAPIRETSSLSDANARLLARARRAVAAALLQSQQVESKKQKCVGWQVWVFTGWTLLMAAASLAYAIGWLNWVAY